MAQVLADRREFLVRCSMVEVYKERIVDLLGREKVTLQQHPRAGTHLQGARVLPATTAEDLLRIYSAGLSKRATG